MTLKSLAIAFVFIGTQAAKLQSADRERIAVGNWMAQVEAANEGANLAQVEAADEGATLAQTSALSVGDAYEEIEGLFAQYGADAETELAQQDIMAMLGPLMQ